MKHTKVELAQITADRKYWQRYGKLIGARLLGWTYRQSASFIVPDDGFDGSMTMTSYHARMVDAALAKNKKWEDI